MKDRRLGRGLESLLGAAPEADATAEVVHVPLDQIVPNPFQPRKMFSRGELDDLVRSIREKGVLQPILLRRNGAGYELIVGERRWRAAREAGLSAIPAMLKPLNDGQMLEVALIENTQRADLNAIERAVAYRELITRFNLTQDEAATKLGLDRSTVANFVRLLELPADVQDLVSRGTLSMGHARALLAVQDPVERLALARRAEREGLSVRQMEQLAREKRKPSSKTSPRAAHLQDLEERIRAKLGSKVRIVSHGQRGYLQIEYYSLEHFDQILSKLGV